MASNNHRKEPARSTAVVLYGLDETSKPRAACFAAKDAAPARKAAGLMGLNVATVDGPQLVELAAKLPIGRLYSSGKGLVPNIRAKLYEQVVQATSGTTASGANGGKDDGRANAGIGGSLPPPWATIDIGQVVVAKEGEKDMGWSEATIVHRHDDMFTLRWRDPPNKKLVTYHRVNLALLYPTASGEPPKSESSKSVTTPGAHANPVNWSEIGVGSLVLAKDDGPLQGWWEAVVTGKADESLTLQWRDHANLAKIVRERVRLALLCPIIPAATKAA